MSITETATSIRRRLMVASDGHIITARTEREVRALQYWEHKGYVERIPGMRYILTYEGHYLRDIIVNGP
jgi:hypothetical protein